MNPHCRLTPAVRNFPRSAPYEQAQRYTSGQVPISKTLFLKCRFWWNWPIPIFYPPSFPKLCNFPFFILPLCLWDFVLNSRPLSSVPSAPPPLRSQRTLRWVWCLFLLSLSPNFKYVWLDCRWKVLDDGKREGFQKSKRQLIALSPCFS